MDHQPNHLSEPEEIAYAAESELEEHSLEQPERLSASGATSIFFGLTIATVFILGLAIGFFGRPLLIKDLPIEVVVTAAPNAGEVVAQANPQMSEAETQAQSEIGGGATAEESEAAANSDMPTPTIMDFVLSDARHFQGDDAAPVTIVEFSDFN